MSIGGPHATAPPEFARVPQNGQVVSLGRPAATTFLLHSTDSPPSPPRSIKSGKVVIVLNGRYAGRKAVVISTFEESDNKERKFGHALIAGIDRYPRKITRAMTEEQKVGRGPFGPAVAWPHSTAPVTPLGSQAKRMRVKPFVKFINLNHIMPTRYNLDVTEQLAKLVPKDGLTEEETKKSVKKNVKDELEKRYKNIAHAKNEKVAQGVHYFFRCVVVGAVALNTAVSHSLCSPRPCRRLRF